MIGPIRIYKIPLACQLCGSHTGDAAISSEYGWLEEDATQEAYFRTHGIVDNRCTSCLNIHGDFGVMARRCEKEYGMTPQQSEDFVKKHPKKADFEKQIIKQKHGA